MNTANNRFLMNDTTVSKSNDFNKAISISNKPLQSIPTNTTNSTPVRLWTQKVRDIDVSPTYTVPSEMFKYPAIVTDYANHSLYTHLNERPQQQNTEHEIQNKITVPTFENIRNGSLTPFFGSRVRQDMSGTGVTNDYRTGRTNFVGLYTGSNDWTVQNKTDTPNAFFSPNESKERYILDSAGRGSTTVSIMDIDRDRFGADVMLKDDCFARENVGPAIDSNAETPAAGGFHPYYRWIDDDKQRHYSYGTNMLGVLPPMKPPSLPKVTAPKASQIPRSNIIATKPRIFDGAIDQHYKMSFHTVNSCNDPLESTPSTQNFITTNSLNVHKDSINSDISDYTSSKNVQRDVSKLCAVKDNVSIFPIEEFTDAIQNQKRSQLSRNLEQPVIPNKMGLDGPELYDRENSRHSDRRCTNIHTASSLFGKKGESFGSKADGLPLDRNANNRTSTSTSSLPSRLLFAQNVLQRPELVVDRIDRQQNCQRTDTPFRPIVPSTLSKYPQNTSNNKNSKEISNNKMVPNKIQKNVTYRSTSNDTSIRLRDTNKTTENKNLRSFGITQYNDPNRFVQHTDPHTVITDYPSKERLIFQNYSDVLCLPNKSKYNENEQKYIQLRDTKRNNDENTDPSNLEFGVIKGTKTKGESMDNIAQLYEPLTLKKEEKMWPSSIQSKTHYSGNTQYTNCNNNTDRITKRVVCENNDNIKTPTPSVLPNDFFNCNTRSGREKNRLETVMEHEVRRPNPETPFGLNSTNSQEQFYRTMNSIQKNDCGLFLNNPIPRKAPIGMGPKDIGTLCNVRT